MQFFNEKNIKIIVFASSIVLVSILSVLVGALYITDKQMELDRDLPLIEQEYISQQKEILHYAVNLQINQIDFRRKQIKARLQDSLSSRVLEAKDTAENLFAANNNSIGHEQKNLLLQALRPMRFNQKRGYFFVIGMDSVFHLYPPDPSIEGKMSDEVFSGQKLQVIRTFIDIVREKGGGFLEYDWPVPGGAPDQLYKKITYVTSLQQYDYLIGAGEYFEDFGDMTKENIITDIEKSMGHDPKDYFFIYQLNNIEGGKDFATMLVNPNRPDLIGTSLSDEYRGAHGLEFRKLFLKGLREQGEAFVTYWYKMAGHKDPVQKLSYFKLYPEWNWVIAKGVYLDDLENKITTEMTALKTEMQHKLVVFSLLLLLALCVVIIIAHYFTKGINSIFVEYKNIQKKQHEELERINQYLHKRATIDNLTEIYNRQYFNDLFDQEISRAERYQRHLSLVIFDIDHFKLINDTFGHLTGDSILQELATLMQSQIRESDILARWGGEEFVLLILETDRAAAHALAEKFCRSIAVHIFSQDQQITCSFGVTTYIPGEGATDFLNRADQALYQAKETGRNRVVSK
jgi:diguanylate cyclase (GGDEF)-like protein